MIYRRFQKIWATTTICGKTVYSDKLIFWHRDGGLLGNGNTEKDKAFKKFLEVVGIPFKSLAEANYDGAEYVYLKLNTNKYNFKAPQLHEIVIELNNIFNIGDEFELHVHYLGNTKQVVDSHWKLIPGKDPTKVSSYIVDKVGIRNTLHSDPIKYFANSEPVPAGIPYTQAHPTIKILQNINNKPIYKTIPITSVDYNEDKDVCTTLAILDNGSMFTQIGDIYEETTDITITDKIIYLSYAYKIKYRVIKKANDTSYIVQQITRVAKSLQKSYENKDKTNSTVHKENIVEDTTIKKAIISMVKQDLDDLFINESECVNKRITTPVSFKRTSPTYYNYLIVDETAKMSRKAFANMLGKIIDTGYAKKKTKRWKRILGAVLFVGSLLLGPYLYGLGSLAAIAEATAVSTIALTVSTFIYAKIAPYDTTMIRIIGGVSQIIGYITTIIGVMAIIESTFNKFAEEAVKKEMIKEASEYTTKQFIKDYIVDFIHNKIPNFFKNLVSKFTNIINPSKWSLSKLSEITMSDVSGWIRNLNIGMELYIRFFSGFRQFSTLTENEQSVKEYGVENIYIAYDMINNIDALDRLNTMINNNVGGQKTENFMIQIA